MSAMVRETAAVVTESAPWKRLLESRGLPPYVLKISGALMHIFTRPRQLRATVCLPVMACFFLALALGAGSAAQAADPSPAPAAVPSAAPPQVRVTTSMGDFVIELLPDRAPLTVKNFLTYVKEGFYSGTLIHRVVGNFVVQGGGYASDYQLKPVHGSIFNESGNGLQNKRGMVGLARAGDPHSGNCQFYVNLVDNAELDPLPTRWGYAVFGRVVQGMDVIDRIGVTPTGAAGPFKGDAPVKPVVIQKIEALAAPAAQAKPTEVPVTPTTIGSPQ
jgi:cyclophilin family peptidyl-prolyl cis-trans isomerase